jgi:DNA polymerase-3 subunit alpha
MPDIDIDFCMLRRGEVINYVMEKYGRENVAQIITFGTMAAKAAIKDVGRALDMPYGEVDRLAKMVPPTLNIDLETALKQSPQLRQAEQADERVAELLHIARRLEGLARHASTHAAGVVISPRPLTEFVPLYKSNRDEITTQYDMNALERIGLLKMDFLGLTTLTVLVDAVRLVQENRGVAVELDALPLDDAETYKLFTRGDTTGIFQFESHGMRDILRKYQPSRIEDLTALNALYRPGPIQGGMIDDFIQRKHGRKKVAYELPELREILEETFGVMVYQEQVMQIANRLAGFSLGDADILRRAMGKKKPEEMARQKEKFLAGCAARKLPAGKAEKIFDLMAEFAGYGFNKSHSCAYALLAYQTAYLKTHYPVEFTAALLTSESGNTEKVVKYINEARSMGITVLPPDVNTSGMDFTPVGDAIRFGLRAIKNVGENTVKGILEARAALGRFRSLFQLCESMDPRLLNRRVLESLIKAGALDSLGAPRRAMFEVIDKAMERGQKLHRDKTSGQHGLFGAPAPLSPFESAPGNGSGETPLPVVEEWNEEELLSGEFSTLGFYVSSHPLAKYAARLKELGVIDIATLENSNDDEEVRLAGLLQNVRVLRSKKGERWAVITLQDMTGQSEMLVFSKVFAMRENVLKASTALLVKGRVSVEDAGIRVIVSDVRALEQVAEPPRPICVRIDSTAWNEAKMEELDRILGSRQGPSSVDFEICMPDGAVTRIASNRKVQADEDLLGRVRDLCGPESVLFVSRNGF